MAIQHRRGLKVDFDPNKMLPGEFAYALDTAELFYCYGVGNVKRLATIEDIEILLDTNETAYTALQQLIAELENETVLSGLLADISNLQDNKLDKTGVSSNNTVIFSEASEDEDIVSGESHTTLFGKILKSIKTFRGNISNITTNIGTLASLLTTDRSNLVNAINELHQDHATHLVENVYDKEVHGLEIEEGIWTPSFYFTNVPGNHTLSAANGSYYKIGKLVSLYFAVVVSVFDSSANGTVRIGNLPFPAKSTLFPVSFSDLRNIEHPSIPLGSIMGSIADATGLSIVISQVEQNGTFRYLNSLYFHDGSVIRGGLTYFTD